MSNREITLTQKVNLQFAAIQSSYWISFLPLGGFAAALLQSKNFTDTEIGIILAMQSIASIIAQPVISAFAGKHPRIALKKIIMAMMTAGAAVSSLLYFMPHLFIPAILIFSVIGMTQMSAPAFVNAIAMQITHSGIKVNYGVARGIGSLSFALAGVVLGKLVDLSSINVIIPFAVIAGLLVCVFLSRIYSPPPTEAPAGIPAADMAVPGEMPRTSLWAFLRRNKIYTGFCIASVFVFAGHASISTYLPNIMDSLGGTIADQGITRSIAAAFELPIMFLYSILSRRISSHKLLTFSALSFFLKAVATLFAPSIAILFLVQAFQMPAFGLYTPSAVHFSDHSVTDADRVRAQAISMVASFGIGNVIGNLLSGAILDIWGLKSMLSVASVLGLIGFLIMFFVLYEKPVKLIR